MSDDRFCEPPPGYVHRPGPPVSARHVNLKHLLEPTAQEFVLWLEHEGYDLRRTVVEAPDGSITHDPDAQGERPQKVLDLFLREGRPV